MKNQSSKVVPRRSLRLIRALHGLVFLYALSMFFLNTAPAFAENLFLVQQEFWISLGISFPFFAASGVTFFSLATDSFHGTALCLCFFVLLICIILLLSVTQSAFFLFMGMIILYGVSVVLFFRTLRGHIGMGTKIALKRVL